MSSTPSTDVKSWARNTSSECIRCLSELRQNIQEKVQQQVAYVCSYYDSQLRSKDHDLERLRSENVRLHQDLCSANDTNANLHAETLRLEQEIVRIKDTQSKEKVFLNVVALRDAQQDAARAKIQIRILERDLERMNQLLTEERLEKEALSAELAGVLRTVRDGVGRRGSKPRSGRSRGRGASKQVRGGKLGERGGNEDQQLARDLHRVRQARVMHGAAQNAVSELATEVKDFSRLVAVPSEVVFGGLGARSTQHIRQYLTDKLQAIDSIVQNLDTCIQAVLRRRDRDDGVGTTVSLVVSEESKTVRRSEHVLASLESSPHSVSLSLDSMVYGKDSTPSSLCYTERN